MTCRNCLSGYFESQIASGDPRSLRCPEPECTNEALPSDVKEVRGVTRARVCRRSSCDRFRRNSFSLFIVFQLVSKEAFARYDDLLMKKCLSEMRDVVYCVRKACQAPVIVEDVSHLFVHFY